METYENNWRKSANEELVNKKFEILNWLVSSRINQAWVATVPKKFILTAITVLFMVEHNCAKLNEADVLTASCYKANDVPSKMAAPLQIHPRAFRIAFLFQKMYKFIGMINHILGLQFQNDLQFDGYLFHKMYNQMHKQPKKQRIDEIKKVPKQIKIYESSSFMSKGSETDSSDYSD